MPFLDVIFLDILSALGAVSVICTTLSSLPFLPAPLKGCAIAIGYDVAAIIKLLRPSKEDK